MHLSERPQVQDQQLEWGTRPIALGFPRKRAILCPLLEPVQANKNIEGGGTSKGRELEHFRGFKPFRQTFLNF